MTRRLIGSIAISIAAVALAACGNSSTPTGSSTPSSSALKVGLLETGSTSDHGWNQLAADAIAKVASAQTSGTLETQVLDHTPAEKAADAIRQLQSKGFSLVIAHGFEYLNAAKELTDPASPGHVNVKIAVSGGDVDSPNFQSLDYDLAPASYQLGIIAAKVSKTGKLGFIGGDKIPTVTVMAAGFEAGAKSVNPNAVVNTAYDDGKWDDPALAKTKAEAMIAQGVDVIMQNVDAASSGIFEAVKERNATRADDANKPTVYTFGREFGSKCQRHLRRLHPRLRCDKTGRRLWKSHRGSEEQRVPGRAREGNAGQWRVRRRRESKTRRQRHHARNPVARRRCGKETGNRRNQAAPAAAVSLSFRRD